MRGIICFIKGYNWSLWYHWISKDIYYRFCYRCGIREDRIRRR